MSVYEIRLRETIEKICALSSHFMNPQWTHRLARRTVEEWAQGISGITTAEAKMLYEKDSAPSVEDWKSLPHIGNSLEPGVYLGLILTPGDEQDTSQYIGSATGPAKGLSGRVREHQDPVYRSKERERTPGQRGHIYYNKIDECGKSRYWIWRRLCCGSFTSGSQEEIESVRELCVMAEQIYSGWNGSFIKEARNQWAGLADISLWSHNAILPTNYSQPILQTFKNALPGYTPLTVEQSNKRANGKIAQRRIKLTVEQEAARKAHNAAYMHHVKRPADKMKKEGYSEEEIKAFRVKQNAYVDKIAPPHGKMTFATATERTDEIRAEEKSRKRKSRTDIEAPVVAARESGEADLPVA